MSTRTSSTNNTPLQSTGIDIVTGDADNASRAGSGAEPAAEPVGGNAPTLKEQESSGSTSLEDKDWGHLYDIDEEAESKGQDDVVPPRVSSGLSMADVVLKAMKRSLSTPMDDGEVEWHEEDPDWKANNQLSWEDLSNIREIGKGLTCTVYTAKIAGRKGSVIAKVARPKDEGRLEDQAEKELEAEFTVLRQTDHRNIVTLLGAGFTPDGRRFLLLERLTEGTLGTFDALSAKEEMRGPSAYSIIKQGFRRLTRDLKSTLSTILQVAQGLEYLQTDAIPGAVVIHRDLRPDNVGITHGGDVKIFDFGVSKALTKSGRGRLFCPGVGELGSLRYSAPEVSLGLPHGGKADVYSWAMLAWAVASARPPFRNIGRSAFYERVLIGGERPALNPDWPAEFQKLLSECWDGRAAYRPNISQVVARMKDVVASS